MQGYQRILELFDAWDKRDVAIPFSELVESLRALELERADLAVRLFSPIATIAASPSAAALITKRSCSAGRAASAARFTIIWVRHASSESSRGARPRRATFLARAANSCHSGRGHSRPEA